MKLLVIYWVIMFFFLAIAVVTNRRVRRAQAKFEQDDAIKEGMIKDWIRSVEQQKEEQ